MEMSSVSQSWKQVLRDCGGIITQKVDDPAGNVVLIMIQTQMIVMICFAFIVVLYELLL